MKIIKLGEATYVRYWGKWYVSTKDPQKLKPLVFGKAPDPLEDLFGGLLNEEGDNGKNRKKNAGASDDSELLPYPGTSQRAKPKPKPAAKKANSSRVRE